MTLIPYNYVAPPRAPVTTTFNHSGEPTAEARRRALKPMSAGMWARLCSTWQGLSLTGQAGPYLPPPGGLDLRLPDGRYVRMLGLSPKGRHVHYEVLRPRRRKNQAPDRHWMPFKQFMREATVCGFFKRAPDGTLEWVEPMEAADVR